MTTRTKEVVDLVSLFDDIDLSDNSQKVSGLMDVRSAAYSIFNSDLIIDNEKLRSCLHALYECRKRYISAFNNEERV